ncbi:MAG: ABC transporter ATP-binding protein [Candidatus Thorarchaeota archaeon]|nr:ABC transporter ATP-binding protein [Candidatus Thorarchaeota archaeon]
MIIVDDVHFAYDGIYPALSGVSLHISEGERVAIMGANGAGKTTLVKQMNGLLRPQLGHVFLRGADTSTMSVAEIARVVGLVWQNPDHQLFLDTVEKEVTFGLKNLGYSDEEINQRCSRTLSRLGITELMERSPFSLSGGERKRVALASVLAIEPKVLALDEPTIGQDAKQKQNLSELLLELNDRGCAVLCVTHDIEFVIENFPRTIVMAEGKIVADGPTGTVLTNDVVIERCSLTPPELTKAARALNGIFPEVSPRLTLLQELEDVIVELIGGT